MLDRHWLGDLSLAILVALPLVALAGPTCKAQLRLVARSQHPAGDRLPGNGQIGLLG